MERINFKLHTRTALAYFILAAVLGVVLRSFQFIELAVNYKFIVHTHSHIALLGWVYLAVSTLLYTLFLSNSNLAGKYSRIFWFTQLTLAGMLFTFPFMGYAVFSIIFSTLFLFASYWFSWFFLKYSPANLKKTYSFKCIRASLWYLIISSLGPWALGVIMNTLGPESFWYRMAIYFYLHFLYNGWMILSLIGLLVFVIEKNALILPPKTMKRFLWMFNLGIVLTLFLSSLFADPPLVFNALGGLGSILQLLAVFALGISIGDLLRQNQSVFSPFHMGILKTITLLVLVKMVLQIFSAFPYFAGLATKFLDFTIGYLHLTFLGVVTLGLFLFLDYFGMLKISKRYYYWYLCGFVLSELLIFYRAISGWLKLELINGHPELLAVTSLIIVISLIFILVANSKVGRTSKQ